MVRNIIALGAICFLINTTVVHADTYLKYRRTTDAHTIGDKSYPEASVEAAAWIGKEHACYDDGEGMRSVFTFSSRTLAIINGKEKNYTVINLDSIPSMIDQAITDQVGDDKTAAALKAMVQGVMGDVMKDVMTVTKTAEKKKIGSWMCTKYSINLNVVMGMTESETWITKDITIDPTAFNMVKNGIIALVPGFDTIAEEIKKIDGIPVKTVSVTRSMGTDVTTTELLLESAEKKAPKGMYTIPEGFARQSISE